MRLNDMINSMNDALESRDDERRARTVYTFYTQLIKEEEDADIRECLTNIRDWQSKIYLEQKKMDEIKIANAKKKLDELDHNIQEIEDGMVDEFEGASIADLTEEQLSRLETFGITDERYEKALERYYAE